MATKAIYTSTSGTSQFARTAKSPKISAPSILKELLSTSGVFSEASFSRSTINSNNNSCSRSGTPLGSSMPIKASHEGICSGFIMATIRMMLPSITEAAAASGRSV